MDCDKAEVPIDACLFVHAPCSGVGFVHDCQGKPHKCRPMIHLVWHGGFSLSSIFSTHQTLWVMGLTLQIGLERHDRKYSAGIWDGCKWALDLIQKFSFSKLFQTPVQPWCKPDHFALGLIRKCGLCKIPSWITRNLPHLHFTQLSSWVCRIPLMVWPFSL